MAQTTKQALEVSLKRLLLQKPLNKITISDIAADCGISRMTFYYHFKDIYDLVEWVCVEDAARVLDGKKTFDTWQEGFINIFHAILDNRPFIMNVYRVVSRERIEQYLAPLVRRLIMGVVEEKAEGLAVNTEDKKFIAIFYEHAFVGVMLDWIAGGMKGEPEVIADQINRVMQGNVLRALEAFGAEPKEENLEKEQTL